MNAYIYEITLLRATFPKANISLCVGGRKGCQRGRSFGKSAVYCRGNWQCEKWAAQGHWNGKRFAWSRCSWRWRTRIYECQSTTWAFKTCRAGDKSQPGESWIIIWRARVPERCATKSSNYYCRETCLFLVMDSGSGHFARDLWAWERKEFDQGRHWPRLKFHPSGRPQNESLDSWTRQKA